ncbi:LysM peptidoglycan-binding domain-containing protein [bacterium]|nr:LysM peptidoglycan-binding domain-containing protein [bacterium]
MKVVAGGFLEARSSEGKELSGNKGIFVKGYMYGPGGAAVEKGRETTYTVRKGDCLWNIAGRRNVYRDSAKWPKIYRANRNKIKNPDLIYPGQVLVIPR